MAQTGVPDESNTRFPSVCIESESLSAESDSPAFNVKGLNGFVSGAPFESVTARTLETSIPTREEDFMEAAESELSALL